MQYVAGIIIGLIISGLFYWFSLTSNGELHVYNTEDGIYLSLELASMDKVNKPFIFLKIKHFSDTH